MDKSKSKIAIISHSLGSGGAERFSGLLSCILSDLGFNVHTVVVNEDVDYEYCGVLYNLGEICNKKSFFYRKIMKGILLNRYLKFHDIDVVIDNRSRNVFLREWIAKWIYGDRKRYYVIHSCNIKNYLPNSAILAKLLYGNAEKLICVSKAIEARVIEKYNFKNTVTIYNPVVFNAKVTDDLIQLPKDYILFFGRLEEKSKNFSLMLEAFSNSKIFEMGYKLVIMGDGPDSVFIENKISQLNLQNLVYKIPFNKNPFKIVKEARFTILTSNYEGFPMSVIESLAIGTPVVSVNCDSGPAEIIINEYNGLLVQNHNCSALADAMRKFVSDDNLYTICKGNASSSVKHLSVESISKQWAEILS